VDVSQLTVSKLAGQAGVSADAVRYYERIGLLPEPSRTASGYRLFDDEAVDRLRFIKRAQRFGLRLDEVGELLEIGEQGLCPCGHTRTLLERRLAQLDQEMAAMAQLRHDIAEMIDDLPEPADRGWQCASALQVVDKPEATRDERKEEER
jgi:DNA-binding transcriptional MerR regulator